MIRIMVDLKEIKIQEYTILLKKINYYFNDVTLTKFKFL